MNLRYTNFVSDLCFRHIRPYFEVSAGCNSGDRSPVKSYHLIGSSTKRLPRKQTVIDRVAYLLSTPCYPRPVVHCPEWPAILRTAQSSRPSGFSSRPQSLPLSGPGNGGREPMLHPRGMPGAVSGSGPYPRLFTPGSGPSNPRPYLTGAAVMVAS